VSFVILASIVFFARHVGPDLGYEVPGDCADICTASLAALGVWFGVAAFRFDHERRAAVLALVGSLAVFAYLILLYDP
jgi:thiol:disulfide interchange protein